MQTIWALGVAALAGLGACASETASEVDSETANEVASGTETANEVDSETETVNEVASETASETESEVASETESEVGAETASEVVNETASEVVNETETESEVVNETETEVAHPTRTVRLVFAGDLANAQGCADHGADDHCDLYLATLDLADGSVSGVSQLTDTAQSESYPAWNPSGLAAYFTILKSPTDKDVGAVDLAGGAPATVVAHAAWPTVSPLGDFALYVTTSAPAGVIMRAPMTAGVPAWASAQPLTGKTNQQDPNVSHLGTAIVYHDTSTGTATAAVYDLATHATAAWSERSGHCAFGASSDVTVCDNSTGGGLLRRDYVDGELGPLSMFLADASPATLGAVDPELAACGGASFNYPTFCGDDQHLLVSTSCSVMEGGAPTVAFSRLFLVDLTGATPRYLPIGKAIADQFGGPGKSTWTVDCRLE